MIFFLLLLSALTDGVAMEETDKAALEKAQSVLHGPAYKQDKIKQTQRYADFFKKILAEAKGDPEKFQTLLHKAYKDPVSYKGLTKKEKEQLQALLKEAMK